LRQSGVKHRDGKGLFFQKRMRSGENRETGHKDSIVS
jgi:hypothetical protein